MDLLISFYFSGSCLWEKYINPPILAYKMCWGRLVFEVTSYRYPCFDLLQSLKPSCSRLSDILLQVWIGKPSQSHPSAWVSTQRLCPNQPFCWDHSMKCWSSPRFGKGWPEKQVLWCRAYDLCQHLDVRKVIGVRKQSSECFDMTNIVYLTVCLATTSLLFFDSHRILMNLIV